MYASTRSEQRRRWPSVSALLFAVCATASSAWGIDESKAPSPAPMAAKPYTLTVGDDLVSVRAADAPLLAILEDLGAQAGFVVESDLATDLRVTLEFTSLPLRQAVQRLTEGTDAAVELSEQPDGLKRLILLSGDGAKTSAQKPAKPLPSERRDPQAPFQFEFDPSAAISK